jgi:hypothetical protein
MKLGGRWSKIRAIEKFKAKNPSLLRKFVPWGGGASPARPVFSGFLPKKPKKHEKTGLSQYDPPFSVSLPLRVGALPLKPKETFASLDFLWHEFLTSGLQVNQ